MAYAAKSDVYANIFGANVSTLYVMGNQCLVGGQGCKAESECQGVAPLDDGFVFKKL
jgi:hypothetical protein